MELDVFKALVEANGGEKEVLSIGFDNSCIIKFIDTEYKHSIHLDEEHKCFKLYETDIWGNTFITYKPLDTIQSVVFKLPTIPRNVYNSMSLS